jgi:hypothetical protein
MAFESGVGTGAVLGAGLGFAGVGDRDTPEFSEGFVTIISLCDETCASEE